VCGFVAVCFGCFFLFFLSFFFHSVSEGLMVTCSVCKEEGHKKNSPSCPQRKRERDENLFAPGTVLEAENDDEYLLYEDTIHPVEYVGYNSDSEKHMCRSVAFVDMPVYEWEAHALHEPRDDVGGEFEVGEQVHVLLRNRGGVGKKGRWQDDLDNETDVWVHATVTEKRADGTFILEHIEWNALTDNFRVGKRFSQKSRKVVGAEEIRKGY